MLTYTNFIVNTFFKEFSVLFPVLPPFSISSNSRIFLSCFSQNFVNFCMNRRSSLVFFSCPVLAGTKKDLTPQVISHGMRSFILWRRRWDSNPRDVLPPTRFRVELVMTTSILLQVRCPYNSFFILPYNPVPDKTFYQFLSIPIAPCSVPVKKDERPSKAVRPIYLQCTVLLSLFRLPQAASSLRSPFHPKRYIPLSAH